MIIAGIMACGALYVIIQFVITPMLSNLKEAKAETEKIQAKLNEIRGVVRDRPIIQEQADEALAAARGAAKHIPLPDLGNYLLGMEESIRSCVDGTDVNIVTVISAGEPLELQGGSGALKIYQTRVILESGLHNLARLFYNIGKKYPYASVSGVTISPNEESPERHTVNFVVSWLIWSDPDKRPDFLLEAEEKGKEE